MVAWREIGQLRQVAESTPREALKGWKSIADFFGRDTSTVMRWSAQRGLPVRRLPGEGRSSVYALPAELAAWLATESRAAPDVAPPAAVVSPAPVAQVDNGPVTAAAAASFAAPRTRRMGYGIAAAAVAAAAAAVVAGRGPLSATRAPIFHNAATERAVLAATYDLDLRTPASLERARAEFGAVIARDPTAAPAYAGLSETYLLLREYTAFPSAEAYRAAAAAAKAAIALDPDLVAAHRALAFVAFWGEHDIPTARAEFARARALDPRNAQTWHWYATALSANGEAAAALDAIGQARRLAPDSTPVASDYGLIAYLAGRRAEGLAALQRVAAASPTHMSSYRYLADLALARGDGAAYLADAAVACRLKDDAAAQAALAAEQAAFARGGQTALLATIAAARARELTPAGGHIALAKIMALQGRVAAADDQLRLAAAAREPSLAELPGEIMLRGLAGQPTYEKLRVRGSLAAPGMLADL